MLCYQIRDFSQYVNWIRAKDRAGNPVLLRQLDKSRWQVDGAPSGAIVEYQIYLDSAGPFGAQLNCASCVSESRAGLDVSRGRAGLANSRCISATCPMAGTLPLP